MIPDEPPSARFEVQPDALTAKVAADHTQVEMKIASMGKSEAEKAAAYKERAQTHLIALCGLMDEAMRDGLLIRWAQIAVGPYGKHDVVDLHLEKRF